MSQKVGAPQKVPGRRIGAGALALLLAGSLSGCTGSGAQGGATPIPRITVGGTPDSQRSLAPDEVLAARKDAGIAACPASDLAATQKPDGLPAITLDCLGKDSKVNLAGLATGRPHVVNVWAQWCTGCVTEAAHVAEFAARSKGKVDVLGIDYNDPFTGKAIDFAKAHGMTYPQVVDPTMATRGPLRLTAIPQTFFVDAQGRVVYRHAAPFTSTQQLVDLVAEKLGVQL